ncbi:alpha/beta hydrolase [Chryseolinea lacunae]|uniref:Alpha/beta hydrolase n=1 Tax=Chryseolinea lacunae TaxID=2801331 RepID=A0ABS1KKL1_9BACT|nr:alpha/beta hydrolase [Chryseolinea lacunae]MBL0739868.1 alpha/beta hydrolase [Chryseolinea lacunae]
MKTPPSKTIVFITGAFITHLCWDNWIPHFESQGYKVIVPQWPNKTDDAEAMRNAHPNPAVASTRLAALTDYFAGIVSQQQEKPILIGHSIGGLIVQLLVQRELAALGVAIHSVPPQGLITFNLSFLKAGWGPLGFFTPVKVPFLMSFKQWQFAFTNGMSMEEQTQTYYKLATPESKLLVRDTITAAAKVDFGKAHAPLLFLAGAKDHTIPASLNYSNYKKYTEISSVTDYKLFESANHAVLVQACWKEKATYILNWIKRQ